MGIASPLKKIAVIGSTGSIGQQTLDIIRSLPQYFQIVALAGGENTRLLRQQIQEFKPQFISYLGKQDNIENSTFLSIEQMAVLPQADIVVMAIGGTAGLKPTLAAVRSGKKIALANKESLVMAGELITKSAGATRAELYPVDSEHSAIWQCLRGEKKISRIILTASGGPFVNYSMPQMAGVTAEQALQHPSWKMGKKITIDSATLMNKGLEIIEARWLFDVPFDNIEVVVHPQSIIHSMVEFIDGSIKAQISNPDMRLPILYALSYPERLEYRGVPRINWSNIGGFTFRSPNMDNFPCLKLAIEAGKKGGTYPTVLCSADETAVEFFLQGKIKFTDIAASVEMALSRNDNVCSPTIEDIIAAAAWARDTVTRSINTL